MHYQGGITNDALSLLEAAVDRRITSVGVQLADAEEQLKRMHADWAPARYIATSTVAVDDLKRAYDSEIFRRDILPGLCTLGAEVGIHMTPTHIPSSAGVAGV
jgi:hypothetical protein